MPSDVNNILRGTGVALEREAFGQFGAAVESQVRNLGLIGGNKVPGVNDVKGPLPLKSGEAPIRAAESAAYAKSGVWEPTRYASALTQAGQGHLDPKQKFLFKVAFHFDETQELKAAISTLGGGSNTNDLNRALTFMVKQIDLPKVTYEYEEVNMYNYRTKVLKSISHRELNFSFMDDIGNSVLDFVNIYRMLLQPMARQNASSWETADYTDYGFIMSGDELGMPSSSLRGPLPGNAKRILRKIVIHQFYLNRGSGNEGTVENMIRTNDFVFLNPQLTEMDFGEMDHENSQLNLVTCNFAFDGLIVKPNQSVFDNGQYKHKDISLDVRDMLTGPVASINVNRGASGITAGGGRPNPFTNIITNQAGRLVQQTVSGALAKTGLGNVAGGALSGVMYQVSGSLGDQTRNAVGGWTQGTAAPNVSYVRDPSVSRQEAQDLSGRQVSTPGDGG